MTSTLRTFICVMHHQAGDTNEFFKLTVHEPSCPVVSLIHGSRPGSRKIEYLTVTEDKLRRIEDDPERWSLRRCERCGPIWR